MRSKILILASLFIFAIASTTKAQKGNPYSDIGKKGETLTLTKGQFDEFFDDEDVQQIGTNLVNIRTMKIVKVMADDEAEKKLDNTIGNRFLSVDPLAKSFPYYSPYQFAGNTPIWANDLDGREPNFVHQGNGIYGIGLFKESDWGRIRRHETKIEIGKGDRKFQIEWLINANGDPFGYLASRIIPEEEYKRLYGGTGQGVQPAYIIDLDKWGDFGSNIDKYFDYSHQAELYDVLWGEIDRSPVKSMFDPRAWLLGRVAGATGKIGSQLLKNTTIFTSIESKILKQVKNILNSKEFDVILDAHKKGVSAEVNVGGTPVFYNPEWTYSEAMTLHSEGGFMLGPKAFTSKGGIKQTVLWEITRLNTQNSGSLGVDQTKPFTQSAEQTSEKLLPFLKD